MVRRFSLGFRSASLLLMTVAALVVISPVPEVQRAGSASPASTKQPISTKAATVSFELNRGQTDLRVKYISHGAGRPLFLKADGLVARLREPESDTDHVVEMKIVGANPQAESEEFDPRPGRSNYFVGNDPDRWQRGVPHYGRVKFKEVYPGIDLVYRGSEEATSDRGQMLEYDFIVNPGADPARIRLQFEGVEDVRVDDQGDLALRTVVGELQQRRPVVYQELAEARRPVNGRFDLGPDGQVGFSVGPYDTDLPLVIDPKVEYSTYLGGSGDDQAFGIKVGPDGSMYVTGWTESPNFPTTDGSGVGGGRDSFTAVFDGDGNLVFSRRVGGSGDDEGRAIAVMEIEDEQTKGEGDSAGKSPIVVTGSRITNDDLENETPIRIQEGYGGGPSDGFLEVVQFDGASGQPLTVSNRAASFLGGNRSDAVDSISLGNLTINNCFGEQDYNLFVTSTTNSTTGMPESECVPPPGPRGGADIHITAISFDLTFSAPFGEVFGFYPPSGTGNETEGRCKVFESVSPIPRDRLYCSYNTLSNDVPVDENAAMSTNPGEQSYIVTFMEPDPETGKPVFHGTTYGGGSEFDQVAGMDVDPNGATAVVGLTFSQLDTTPNAISPTRRGPFDGWLAMHHPRLAQITYQTYLDSNVTAIDFDRFGQSHLAGINGPGATITTNAFQPEFGGGPWDGTATRITLPFVFSNGIGNGASFRPGASPQQISVVVGGLIGPQMPAFLTVGQDGNLLEVLGEASVLVDGEPNPMTFASETQNNFIYRPTVGFPFNLSGKGEQPPVVEVQVGFAGDVSNVVEVPVMEANPGLFALDGSGQGQGAILNPDFTTNGPDNPAPSDGFVIVYGTGGGITDPACPDGGFGPFAEPLPRLQLPVQILVDGDEVNQNYAGSAPGLVCGVNQFNVIPTNSPSGPAVPIQICVNDVCSNIVTAVFE